MTDRLRVTILGCGSSGGSPRVGGADGRGDWGACDPADPRNRRRRCAILVERLGAQGVTRVLVDAGPDLREQLIAAGVPDLDGVLITHDHADHIHGLDDLRGLALIRRARVPVYADARTARGLLDRFGYCFAQPKGSDYPPIMTLTEIDGPLTITGAGGAIRAEPHSVPHGRIEALGFRFGPVAYTPDISAMTDEAFAALAGAECWIVDALRYKPHPSHAHVAMTLDWIARLAPRAAVLTNLHVDLDYRTLAAEIPKGVQPAFDGLTLEFAL